jgi:hypothetical protein
MPEDPQEPTSFDRTKDSLLDRLARRMNSIVLLHCRTFRDRETSDGMVACRVVEVGTDFVRVDQIKFLESGGINLHVSDIVGFE